MARSKKEKGPTLNDTVEHVEKGQNASVGEEKGLQVVPAVSTTDLAPSALQAVMVQEAERRALLTKYISHHMKEGTDYGTIKIGGRDSKPSLFKPGSEKFLSLFKLTAKFERDNETWEMLGSEAGVLTYKCNLIAANGNVVGEGRGVATMREKSWTPNNAVKIAEKRAQIDAVLRTGALSDFFTQDLEDMVQETPKMEPYRVERKYPPMDETNDAHTMSEPVVKIEEPKDIIKRLVKRLGKIPTPKAVRELSGVEMKEENYDLIIVKLEARLNADAAVEAFDRAVDE